MVLGKTKMIHKSRRQCCLPARCQTASDKPFIAPLQPSPTMAEDLTSTLVPIDGLDCRRRLWSPLQATQGSPWPSLRRLAATSWCSPCPPACPWSAGSCSARSAQNSSSQTLCEVCLSGSPYVCVCVTLMGGGGEMMWDFPCRFIGARALHWRYLGFV